MATQKPEDKLETLIKNVDAMDAQRQSNPLQGRKADEMMIELCQFLKDNKKTLPEAQFKKAVKHIESMKLRPYWNYCREHLLDIGLQF